VSKRQLLHFTKSQAPLCLKNLLFLPHLPAQKTHEKQPLIDYSRSHIVTSNKYLQILRKKIMDRKATKIIKEHYNLCKMFQNLPFGTSSFP
jgi:hypothetical protein